MILRGESMNVHITCGSRMVAMIRNATLLPRKGDTMLVSGTSVKVVEVVWHIDNSSWVEVKIDY